MKKKAMKFYAYTPESLGKNKSVYLDFTSLKDAVKSASSDLYEGESSIVYEVTVKPLKKIQFVKTIKEFKNV